MACPPYVWRIDRSSLSSILQTIPRMSTIPSPTREINFLKLLFLLTGKRSQSYFF
jgi:hypothetical protein